MRTRFGFITLLAAALGLALSATACARGQGADGRQGAAGSHLDTFRSQRELDALLAKWDKQRRDGVEETAMPVVVPAPAPAAAGVPQAQASAPATAGSADSITNNQTQGVDEGDIVKRRGDFLIVLRRGRLFTIKIGGDALQPVSQIDVFAPGAGPGRAWYDEMLVSADHVAVIGFSYARQATEIGLFTLAADGTLKYQDTYYLRSNDYYDSRNYASRLIGSTLIFYTPLYYPRWRVDGGLKYPGLARHRPEGVPVDFKRLLPAQAIYRADAGLDPAQDRIALHTVTRCELGSQPLRCTSTAVLGPSGRTFYVSRNAVYVWVTETRRQSGYALRLPLDGGPVSALKVHGTPIDQLSFLEDEGGQLNVLLQSQGRGQGMWRSEWGEGQLALLRVPLEHFGGLKAEAPDAAYRFLPPIARGNRQNRFVGDWLLYGAAPYPWARNEAKADDAEPGMAYALRYAQPDVPIRTLAANHGVERIEALGANAVLVGPGGDDLYFTTVALGSDAATVHARFAVTDARQSESRTHGFSYRMDAADRGVLGLPILRPNKDWRQTVFTGVPLNTAAVLYLGNNALDLRRMGELASDPKSLRDDHCIASCVDWYGNARPIFIGPRVFALLGYELVEGRLTDGNISERRRVNFTPQMEQR